MAYRVRTLVGFVSLSLLMIGCDDQPDNPPMHAIGGTVSGVFGTGFALQNGLGGAVSVAPGASTFTFSPLPEGTEYNITVRAQPIGPGQECTVTNGVGKVGTEPVTNVVVTCARTTERFAYVTNPTAQSISSYSIHSSGLLVPISGFALTGSAPTAMVFEPTRRFGYVATGASATIGHVSVNDDTGALTLVANVPTGNGVFELAMDPVGRFLFASSTPAGEVYAFSIDQTAGALTPVPGSPFALGGVARELKVDTTGRFLYVGNESQGAVSSFAIDQTTGALTPLPGSPVGAVASVLGIEISPDGERLYAVGSGGSIAGFTLDVATGALSPLPGSPFAATPTSCSMAINPADTFAFVANTVGTNGTVSSFVIENDGGLGQIQGSPVAAGSNPCSVTVDPTGAFVYVANPDSANISGYSINTTTGALTALVGSPYAAGNGANTIVIR